MKEKNFKKIFIAIVGLLFIIPIVANADVIELRQSDFDDAPNCNSQAAESAKACKQFEPYFAYIIKDGDYKLTENISADINVLILGSTVNLDMNAKTISLTDGARFDITNSIVTISGNGTIEGDQIITLFSGSELTIENGSYYGWIGSSEDDEDMNTLTINDGYFHNDSNDSVLFLTNIVLTINGGFFDNADYKAGNNNVDAVLLGRNGTITINGGTYRSNKCGLSAINSILRGNSFEFEQSIVVNGGLFVGLECGLYAQNGTTSINIYGGSFVGYDAGVYSNTTNISLSGGQYEALASVSHGAVYIYGYGSDIYDNLIQEGYKSYPDLDVQSQSYGYKIQNAITVVPDSELSSTEYLIYFDKNSSLSTLVTQQRANKGEDTYLYSASFFNPGYYFNGWNTQADGEGVSYSDRDLVNFTENTTLYAQWEPMNYTVNYDGLGASGSVESQHLTTEDTLVIATNGFTTPTGYKFNGWSTTPDGTDDILGEGDEINFTPINNNDTITLYAIWQPITYTISYDANGGSGTTSSTNATYNQNATIRDNSFTAPTGYSFKEWNTQADGEGTSYSPGQTVNNLTAVDDDTVTLYAIWKANNYTIHYMPNGASGNAVTNSKKYDQHFNIISNPFNRNGYTFVEWNTQADGEGTSYEENAEVSNLASSGNFYLYAIWQPRTFTVKYRPGLGVGETVEQNATYGETKTISNPFTKTGYKFGGWSMDSNSAVSLIQENQLITIVPSLEYSIIDYYAYWEPISYTIEYNGNYGTGVVDPQSVSYNEEVNISNNNFTRDHYVFTGWNTSPTGDGTSYSPGQTVSNLTTTDDDTITLYAQWRPYSYYLKYMSNGGEGSMDRTSATYGTPAVLSENEFTAPTGYKFNGWSTTPDGTGQILGENDQVNFSPSQDGLEIYVYAIWQPITYTVEYNGNYGTGIVDPQTVSYDELFNIRNNEFTKATHVFTGWNTSPTGNGDSYTEGQEVSNLTTTDDSTITLYAQWRGYKMTFVYNANGGTGSVEPQVYYYGDNTTLRSNSFTAPTGYKFNGWSLIENGTGDIFGENDYLPISTSEDDIEVPIYAIWQPIHYTISYFANGGEGSVESQYVSYIDEVTIQNNGFTRDGYLFKGWNTDPEGTGTSYTEGQVVSGVTSADNSEERLYAEWEAINSSIDRDVSGIDFGTEEIGFTDKNETAVTITNDGNVPVAIYITNPTGDGPFGSLGFENGKVLQPGETYTAILILHTSSPYASLAGSYEGIYQIIAKDPETGEEVESLPVQAIVTIVEPEAPIESVSVKYSTHIQNFGWQKYKADGEMAGTSGQSKRLEGIKIKLENAPYSGDIEYRTHIQNIGWQKFKKNDEMSGTSGQAKRLEAIEIRLTGEMAEHYDVYYRVHAQSFGWLGWARNGESSGTEGYAYRLEAIEIKLIPKGESFSEYGKDIIFYDKANGPTKPLPETAKVAYKTHVQNIGWQYYVSDGETSGTVGKSKRLEGIKIKLVNQAYEGDIEYRTHIQNIGWQKFKKNDEMSGTSGQAKRLEAIEIRLTGEMAEHYDVYYRVHAQSFGWLGWARNGESSGTEGYAYRLEAIEIKLIPKGESFSEYGTKVAFRKK